MPGPDEPTKNAGETAEQTAKPTPGKKSDGEPVLEVKRPEGRPRKHPLPTISGNAVRDSNTERHESTPERVTGTVAVAPAGSFVESALLLHTAGAPAVAELATTEPVLFKRPRGRPRKRPLPGAPGTPAPAGASPAASPGRTAIPTQAPAAVVPVPLATTGQAVFIAKRPRGRPRKHPLPDSAAVPGGVSTPPGQTPKPGLIGEKRVAGLVEGTRRAPSAEGRPRGQKRKSGPSILNPFCPECGTYLRMFRPPRGRWRKVCPRCEPDRMIVKRDYRDYIDKTGMPCKDRGKCRPERCVKALDCTEMGRYR